MCGLKDKMKRLCLEACTIHTRHTIYVTHKSVLLCYMTLDICRLAVIKQLVSGFILHDSLFALFACSETLQGLLAHYRVCLGSFISELFRYYMLY